MAAALVWLLAWKLPYATGGQVKKKKRQGENKKNPTSGARVTLGGKGSILGPGTSTYQGCGIFSSAVVTQKQPLGSMETNRHGWPTSYSLLTPGLDVKE